MKDGKRGQHFPDINAIMATVEKPAAHAGADFYCCNQEAHDK